MRPLSRITRYVLSELIPPTFLGLGLYTFVLLTNHLFVVAEKALSKNLDFELTLRLFAAGIPQLLVLTIPMAVLLGCLVGIGRLSADEEWTALQSAGCSPGALLRPAGLLGLAGAVGCFCVYAFVVPSASYALRSLQGELIFASNLAADLRPRAFYTDLPDDAVLFVDEIRPGGQRRLERVLLIQEDPQQGTTTLALAASGDLYPAPGGQPALMLDLYEGVGYSFQGKDSQDYRMLVRDGGEAGFEKITQRMELAPFIQRLLEPPNRVVRDFSWPELWGAYRDASTALDALGPEPAARPGAPRELRTLDWQDARRRLRQASIELHQRLAIPFTALLFALIAVPLGARRARGGKGAGFALSLLVIAIYWLVFTVARNQAQQGRLPAILGPWAGNLVLVPWLAIGIWRMRFRAGEGPIFRPGPWLERGISRLRVGGRESPADDRRQPRSNRRRWVGILDQYIATHYLRVLVVTLASAYAIFGLVELRGLSDGALRTHASLGSILEYFGYFAPTVLQLVLPLACLVAAVVSFTLLARTGELVAIRSSGVSLVRATVPVLAVTLFLCGAQFLVQDRIAPTAGRRAQEVQDRIMGRPPRTHGLPSAGRWSFGPEGRRLYHYRVYDRESQTFHGFGVFTLDRENSRFIDHRFAERARWIGNQWQLERSWLREFPHGTGDATTQILEGTTVARLDPPSTFAAQEAALMSSNDSSDLMSLEELGRQIAVLQDRGYDVTRLEVLRQSTLAQSVAPLVMVLLGLPFALWVGRRGSLYGVGVAILLVLVYWAAFAVSRALGLETLLRPVVAAWAPNLFFGALGLLLLLEAER